MNQIRWGRIKDTEPAACNFLSNDWIDILYTFLGPWEETPDFFHAKMASLQYILAIILGIHLQHMDLVEGIVKSLSHNRVSLTQQKG